MPPYTLTDTSITCHRCGNTSTNPHDRRERFCVWCQVVHEALSPPERCAATDPLCDQPGSRTVQCQRNAGHDGPHWHDARDTPFALRWGTPPPEVPRGTP